MTNLKDYQLVKDDKLHFRIKHKVDGKEFDVIKSHLDARDHAAIQKLEKFSEGGQVEHEPEDIQKDRETVATHPNVSSSSPTPKPSPTETIGHKIGYPGYADGGEVDHVCKNKACKSYGVAHPNCQCYSEGGIVHFCEHTQAHEASCPHFSEGGQVDDETLAAVLAAKNAVDKENATRQKNSQPLKPYPKEVKDVMDNAQTAHAEQTYADGGEVEQTIPGTDIRIDDQAVAQRAEPQASVPSNISDSSSVASIPAVTPVSASSVASQAPVSGISEANAPAPVQMPQEEQPQAQLPQTNQNVPPSASPLKTQQQEAAQPLAGPMELYKQGLGTEMAGVEAERAGMQMKAMAEVKGAQDAAAGYRAADSYFRKPLQDTMDAYTKEAKAYAQGKITPPSLFGDSFLSKAGAAISLFLSGGQSLQMFKDIADREMESQKINLDKHKNLMSMYLDRYKDLNQAKAMTYNTILAKLSAQATLAAAQAGTPLAAAQAAKLIGAAQMQASQTSMDFARKNLVFNVMNANSTSDQANHTMKALAVASPEEAKNLAPYYLPGVGMAAKPVPNEVHNQIMAAHEFGDVVKKLQDFANKGPIHKITPSEVNYFRNLTAQGQQAYRTAQAMGVYKMGEVPLFEGLLPPPDKFLADIRTIPAYQALQDGNAIKLKSLTQGFGVTPFADSSLAKNNFGFVKRK